MLMTCPLGCCHWMTASTQLPHLTRSSLHCCLQRHGISRLPEIKGDPIGYVHVDIAQVQTAERKLYLFGAIDRTLKFALTELHP